jgi:transketolase
MFEIQIIPKEEFDRIWGADAPQKQRLSLIADMCRANALSTVKKAGSGHLGSSFSSLDIVTMLYYVGMNTVRLGINHPDRDIYFSSKGHDVPGHYAVLYSLGVVPRERFVNLRRFGGTHGHPDLNVPGIEANSGSLGMGISKAKGMAWAKRHRGQGGRVFVMTGDGELQEGQIWESLQTTAHQRISNVNVIVDFNKIQTDLPVSGIISLGEIEQKFRSFGWHVTRCSGHDFDALDRALKRMGEITDRPKALIADTIKGKGVSFMEGPAALEAGGGFYRWHAGAPDDDAFETGFDEIVQRINGQLDRFGMERLHPELLEKREKHRTKLKDVAERVVNGYGDALLDLGTRRKDIVVLDADLAADCGLRPFQGRFPERFVENGIAEQDMVSMAGGLALQGLLPIVNSFGVFLASRANEQIYNNATENTKIIYVCHYAGLIPAGPGKSHQSLRDVSLFGALPNCVILEPCNTLEVKQALNWCVDQTRDTCMMRLVISPSPRSISLPEDYELVFGRGAVLNEGHDAAIFAYGPVMLHEALVAAEGLTAKGVSLKVINMPWLNRLDRTWLAGAIEACPLVFTLDNHSTYGGLGDSLLNGMAAGGLMRHKTLVKFGLGEHPACGTPQEALAYHRLDGQSLASRILEKVGG